MACDRKLMMPNPRVANGQWTEAVGPIAAKLEVGATFGERTVFNREGSKALAELLREMARIIDNEIEHRKVSE